MLTVINGYSDLLLRQIKEDDAARFKVEEIRKAGTKAASLTQQLLAFSRKQMLQPKVLELNGIIIETEMMLQRVIGEDIQLISKLDKNAGEIYADPGQITQVIMNLVVNARDAMPGGGKLTIETTNVYFDEEYAARHFAIKTGGYVMLAVSDTGTGMDAETQKHIFEPFFTTKELGRGTGLGLATTYGIVKQSGGNIWVYSEQGKGTTFKIYLPLIEKGLEPELINPVRAKLPVGAEKILLVEDEDVVRGLTKQILELCGYTVLEAINGADALALCQKEECDIDLLVTDVIMPEMSGRDLAAQMTEKMPKLRVLYMSGYTDSAIVHHSVVDADVNFIQKPFTPESMARKVREVLDAAPAH
jgi:CheY-like chemotaxis protein